MAPFDPATIARRPSRTPRPRAIPAHVPVTARRRQDFYAPIVDPVERTITIWRWETLIGSLLGLLFLPTIWLLLYVIVRISK